MTTEAALRRFLLVGVVVGCVGVAAELVLIGHTGSKVQWIPLVLAAAGIAGSAALTFAPGRKAVWLLRSVGLVLAAGALFGIYEHMAHNYAFEVEIRPGGSGPELLYHAVTGASPLLAPGAFLLVALLAFGATWRHPSVSG